MSVLIRGRYDTATAARLASIGLIVWAWLGSDGLFLEKVTMSLLGLGGVAGGWAAFTRQRWIELRANQIEQV